MSFLGGATDGFMKAAAWGTPERMLRMIEERRALVGDPEFLLLDEATSSVDPLTEAVIQKALAMPGFAEDSNGQSVMVGFGRGTVMSVAGQVIEAVKNKNIRHFFLVGGCDGAKPARNYFTEFVEKTPDLPVDLVIKMGLYRPDEVAPEVIAGYTAPFPDASYKAGARAWPTRPPGRSPRSAWSVTLPDTTPRPGAARRRCICATSSVTASPVRVRRASSTPPRWTVPMAAPFLIARRATLMVDKSSMFSYSSRIILPSRK